MRQGLLERAVRRACEAVSRRLSYRNITRTTDYGEEDLYLVRHRLLHTRWVNVVLHYFVRSDGDAELHNHPWHWATSLILAGGYSEERRGKDQMVWRKEYRPGMLNFIGADTFHRVDLHDEIAGVWTLFVTGPKIERSPSWGFWDRRTRHFTGWRDFLAQRDRSVPLAVSSRRSVSA